MCLWLSSQKRRRKLLKKRMRKLEMTGVVQLKVRGILEILVILREGEGQLMEVRR